MTSHGPHAQTSVAQGVGGTPLTVTIPGNAPEGEPPTRGVVVVQEAFGVSPSLVSATARLAAQGYLAVAPHLYHRATDGPVETLRAARPLMAGLNGPDLAHDLADAREYLASTGIGPRHMGIVGFCMGGTVALWAAATMDLGAAVTFYGGGVSKPRWTGVPAGVESGAQLRMPWLGMYGDKDPTITIGEVERLREVTAAAEVPTDIVRYADAGHAFANDPSSPNYVAEAAADTWARALSWFDAHLR